MLSGFSMLGIRGSALRVENSSDITVLNGLIGGTESPSVRITGSSSKVTFGRYRLLGHGTAVQVDPGVRDAVVTTNYIHSNATAISATDAPGTIVVANTVHSECHDGIALAGASTGATIENNVVETGDEDSYTGVSKACAAGAADTGITVSTGSTSGTKADYNVVSPLSGGPAYNWAGKTYTGQKDFTAATTQGAHDFFADPAIPWHGDNPPISPVIDSADEHAPGMLPVDAAGRPAADDPLVANTGTGSGFRDRGAYEFTDFGSLYTPVTPARLLDTREGLGGTTGPVTGGHQVDLQLPAELKDATAVVLNVTVADTDSSGFLTVYPHGKDKPLSSNLNWSHGQTIANQTTVAVKDGKVSFYVGGGLGHAQLIADLEGYYGPHGSSFSTASPARLLDTRDGGTQLQGGKTLDLQVAGVKGIPANGVTAVTLNVTSTRSTSDGYLTAFPHGQDKPVASNLNWEAGQTIANQVTVPVIDGKVSLYAATVSGGVDVIADVAGYYSDQGYATFRPVDPYRAMDTRLRQEGSVGSGGTLDIDVSKLPVKHGSVVLNVTVATAHGTGYATVYPHGTERPLASSLNWEAGQTIANQVTVPVIDGKVSLYNGSTSSTDFVVDVLGYHSW